MARVVYGRPSAVLLAPRPLPAVTPPTPPEPAPGSTADKKRRAEAARAAASEYARHMIACPSCVDAIRALNGPGEPAGLCATGRTLRAQVVETARNAPGLAGFGW